MPAMKLPITQLQRGLETPSRHTPPQVLLVTSRGNFHSVSRLPRLFGRAGFEVSVLTCEQSAVLCSRFTRRSEVIDGGVTGLADYLEERLDDLTERHDWILPCDEPLLVELAGRPGTDRLSERLPFLPNRRDLQLLLSNIEWLTVARAAGLPVAEFEVCQGLTAAAVVAERLGYPVILKKDFSMAGCGVRLIRNEAELDAWYGGAIYPPRVIVQRYVRGRCGQTPILFDRGRPVCWFSAYKLFNWPRDFSPSGGGKMMHDGRLDAWVQAAPGLRHFHGFCSIDWIQNAETGEFHPIELNPRVVPALDPVSRHGCDFSRALAAMWSSAALPAAPDSRNCAGDEYAMFPEAAHRAVDDRNLALFFRSLREACWSDPGLLYWQARDLIVDHLLARARWKWRLLVERFRQPAKTSRNGADTRAVQESGWFTSSNR